MENLLTVDDVAGIMRVSKRTAYTYMRQMIHTETPLRVTEASLREWIEGRIVDPEEKKRRKNATAYRHRISIPSDYHIPRRRP